MNVADLNEPFKWLPVRHSLSETLVPPPPRQNVIDQHGVCFPEEALSQDDEESGRSWDDDLDDDLETGNDLLAFAQKATSRLESLMRRNEGQEDNRLVYDSSNRENKSAQELYYSDILSSARLDKQTPAATGSVPYANKPSLMVYANLNSSCHSQCTGQPNKSAGLGPFEELFWPVSLSTPFMNNHNEFYEGTNEDEERNCYYYDDKMYEFLMTNEADAACAFWNRSCDKNPINNLSEFPFL